MKAHVITAFGGTDVFKIIDIPQPKPKKGEVLIQVKASSLNPIDVRIRTGGPPWSPQLPGVLHGDVSGVVTSVGADVKKFKVGDAVYGYIGGINDFSGAIAEYAVADENLLAHKPKELAFTEAAVLPLVSITAWLALFDRANLKAGDHVLIHAGAGGVGHIAIQLARAHGARIATTISTNDKAELVKSFGADEIINYKTEKTDEYVQRLTHGRGFDLVFDTVGGANLTESFKAVRTSGSVVTINSRAQIDLTPFHTKGITLHVVFMLIPLLQHQGLAHYGDILHDIAGLVETGKLKPLIDSTSFMFSNLSEAHAYWESGKALGKISLVQDF